MTAEEKKEYLLDEKEKLTKRLRNLELEREHVDKKHNVELAATIDVLTYNTKNHLAFVDLELEALNEN